MEEVAIALETIDHLRLQVDTLEEALTADEDLISALLEILEERNIGVIQRSSRWGDLPSLRSEHRSITPWHLILPAGGERRTETP